MWYNEIYQSLKANKINSRIKFVVRLLILQEARGEAINLDKDRKKNNNQNIICRSDQSRLTTDSVSTNRRIETVSRRQLCSVGSQSVR